MKRAASSRSLGSACSSAGAKGNNSNLAEINADDIQLEGKCSIAKRVPRVKRTSNTAAFMEQVNERNALVKLIDRVVEQPGLAQKTWSALDNGLVKLPGETTGASKDTFDKKVTKVGALPVDFIAAFLVEASQGKLSKETADKIDGYDSHALLHLFMMATKTAQGTPLPQAMRDRKTCTRVFLDRYAKVGKRLDDIAKHVSAEGAVDWVRGGPYRLKFAKDKLLSVSHIQGATVDPVPSHVVVTREFKLEDGWLDLGAKLVLGSTSHQLAALFPKNGAPHDEKIGKGGALLDATCEAVLKKMGEERKAADKGELQDSNFLKTHDTQMAKKRQAVLADARKKLQEEGDKRRKLALQPTPI